MKGDNKNYIADIHKENEAWLNDLKFFSDELVIFDEELQDVSSKNTDQEFKMEVEKFQNQFIIQKNEIDYLKHLITIQEDFLVDVVKANPVAVDHKKVAENTTLKERFEIFEPIYAEMKTEFRSFLGKYL